MRLKKEAVPYIVAEPLPSNLLEWHYVVEGPESRFITKHMDKQVQGLLIVGDKYILDWRLLCSSKQKWVGLGER